ncbi:UDP-glucose 4-epimerase [Tamaricihabitans halophyticus]|uniref:UDP-glucose 4-epimerase n=1 Tax=Tamaricihabitans halophyticus TaxID=1262583 RepID=A0A4R2R5C5_9PSEU|nr:NAD-dependent epimerase/dehydratase family protein [Tamaricihabitans halophyticus]TCP56989.1 UDP-glucose 4-epimerase [Tamaricihabitans halophyticus]
MRVLVTGAAGFLGRAVSRALAARGHEVVALVHSNGVVPHASEVLSGDLLIPGTLRAAVRNIDAVCHLAAATRVRESFEQPAHYWRLNMTGTLNLLDAVSAVSTPSQPIRLVLASTAAVYGVPELQPITEDVVPVPLSPYGASKLAADQATAQVAALGSIGAVSLRSFNVAGAVDGVPDEDLSRVIPRVLAVQIGHATEMVVNGDGGVVRDYVHVADMAHAFLLALDACEPGAWRAYNVGSGQHVRVADVLAATEKATGRPVRTRYRPPANEPEILLADSTRIMRELGWQPRRSEISQIVADGWNALTGKYSTPE